MASHRTSLGLEKDRRLLFKRIGTRTRLPLVEKRAVWKALVVIRDQRIRISDDIQARAIDLVAAV
jgi:hypothetical protein